MEWNFDPFSNNSFNHYGNNPINASHSAGGIIQRTQSPKVWGGTTLGVVYQDGVMLAADTLGSWGQLARYRKEERLYPVGNFTAIAYAGDMSDFQYTKHMLDSLMIKEYYINDDHVLSTPHVYEYLSRVMYHRRTKMDPLWNTFIVGGYNNGERFLGYVDLLGTTYQSSAISTGLGAYYAQPILRKAVEGREGLLTEAEAIELLNSCMRVLFYRDCKVINSIQRAKVTAAGVEITEPYSVSSEWGFGEGVRGFGSQKQ
ncbi:1119_t:CDS:2 [Paraglomus occultum]|uniref:Proteasome subunit beta n=1 Tax=Paraglomus occultum TaxID=144539 RepID=A0A9N8ZEJ6_9GLOM|nr:1119_t:CDS:2 [Paraglomus occultum]